MGSFETKLAFYLLNKPDFNRDRFRPAIITNRGVPEPLLDPLAVSTLKISKNPGNPLNLQ